MPGKMEPAPMVVLKVHGEPSVKLAVIPGVTEALVTDLMEDAF